MIKVYVVLALGVPSQSDTRNEIATFLADDIFINVFESVDCKPTITPLIEVEKYPLWSVVLVTVCDFMSTILVISIIYTPRLSSLGVIIIIHKL